LVDAGELATTLEAPADLVDGRRARPKRWPCARIADERAHATIMAVCETSSMPAPTWDRELAGLQATPPPRSGEPLRRLVRAQLGRW
jgi:hypothetical protein